MKKEDVEHLANLARIELQGSEAETLATDITSIVDYISVINDITAETGEKKEVGALYNVMREDTDPHEGGIYTEDILNNAPVRKGQYIEVKKILGGDD